jgi:FUN14 family
MCWECISYISFFNHILGAGDDDLPHSWAGAPLLLALSSAAGLSTLGFPPPAVAKDDDIENYVDRFMTTAGPILTTLGFSGFIGLCVGKALKAVSGCIAIAVGLTFIGVQLFAHFTGEKFDFLRWERNGLFEKEELSDALKAGLDMLTQVRCLSRAKCYVISHSDYDNVCQTWGWPC